MLRLSLNASVRNCFAAALTLHALLMLLVVVSGYRSANQALVVPAIDPNVRVVFSPFAGSAMVPSGHKKASSAKSAPQKEPAKREPQKKQITALAQPKKHKAGRHTVAEKKPAQAISRVAPPVDKKQAGKKQAPAKKEKRKKKSVETKNVSEAQKPVPVPVSALKVLPGAEQASVEVVPEEIVVGRAQYEEYRIAREIRSAIERTWVAPRGTENEARCVLVVDIDAQGTVQKIETRTPSGSALFDSAARYAASQTLYPKEVWGKTLVVEFTP